jgi:hypothetical protein
MPGVAGAAAEVEDVAAAVADAVVVVVVARDHRWGTSEEAAAGHRWVAVVAGHRWVADSAHSRPRGQICKGPRWVTLRDPTWPLVRPAVAVSVRLAGGQTPEVQGPDRPAASRAAIDLRCALQVTWGPPIDHPFQAEAAWQAATDSPFQAEAGREAIGPISAVDRKWAEGPAVATG